MMNKREKDKKNKDMKAKNVLEGIEGMYQTILIW